jgi:hypothetical protein
MTKEGIETTMTEEEEIEKNKAPVEEKEGEGKNSSKKRNLGGRKRKIARENRAKSHTGVKAKVILTKVPPVNKTYIATRLDEVPSKAPNQ